MNVPQKSTKTYRVFAFVSRPGDRDVSATWDILMKLAKLSQRKEFKNYPKLELVTPPQNDR